MKMAYECSGVCQSCQKASGYWQKEGKEEERGNMKSYFWSQPMRQDNGKLHLSGFLFCSKTK